MAAHVLVHKGVSVSLPKVLRIYYKDFDKWKSRRPRSDEDAAVIPATLNPFDEPSPFNDYSDSTHQQQGQYAFAVSPARGSKQPSQSQSLAGSYTTQTNPQMALNPEHGSMARLRNKSEHDISTEWDIAGNDRKYDFVSHWSYQ
jgi:hypothetical protein